MIQYMRNIMRREEGAAGVEYGLLVAAIAALIVVVVFALGSLVKDSFSNTCSGIKSGSGSTSTANCNG